jgi:PAS domain S-box-containing protein
MHMPPDFQALFAVSPYPYLLVDTDYLIIGANQAYLLATGQHAEVLLGKHIFDAFPADPGDPESTNVEEVRAAIARAIATGEPQTSALLRYAVPRATADGPVFDVRYWSAIHTPVRDATGAVAFVAQNAIDVTDLYEFDGATRRYHLRLDADAVPDVSPVNRPQMHEALTRILSSERHRLQAMFDQAPGSMAIMSGPDHVFDMVNEAYYALVGRRDLIGKPALAALPELAGQGLHELLDSGFATGERIVLHERLVTLQRVPGGPPENRYVDLLYQPMVGRDGRVTGIFAQANDVTAACLARRELCDKLRQLETAKSNQAFQLRFADRIWELDDAGRIEDIACEMLGARLDAVRVWYADIDEALGIALYRCDWTTAGFPGLAGRSIAIEDIGQAALATLRGGRPVANQRVVREDDGVRAELLVPYVKAGELKGVLAIQDAAARTWQDDELALVTEAAGRTWSALEATHARHALQIERDQSQYIFDAMAEGFAVLDRHWTILRMNAEGLRLTQRSAAEVIGRSHWDVWPELRHTDAERAYQRVMDTGKTETVELSHLLPDGRRAWMEIRTHRSLEGGIAFFFHDITQRKVTQEQLAVADRRKDEFLAMLAHELRNPLAPIGAAADLLQMGQLDEARVRRTSEIIGRQVRHLSSLVDDLLDVSRVTRGQVELVMEPVDIRQVADDAIEQARPLLHARRHHLALALPSLVPVVMGDRKRLVQVLANLLNNAAKYTPAGGHVTLAIDVEPSHVMLRVEDDGIGMAPELVEHAFELFTQAERPSDRSLGGLGLGLALVRSLVNLHGGTVWCASRGIGTGSVFSVSLPRRTAAGNDAGASGRAGEAHAAQERPLRIMVVDDNADAAAMLAMVLESHGHAVMVEHGARSALALGDAIAPDVFLLDIGLPDINGNELARRLRAGPRTGRAMLVAITGYGQDRDRRETLAAGFDHHLVKPVDMRQLFALLAGFRPSGDGPAAAD